MRQRHRSSATRVGPVARGIATAACRTLRPAKCASRRPVGAATPRGRSAVRGDPAPPRSHHRRLIAARTRARHRIGAAVRQKAQPRQEIPRQRRGAAQQPAAVLSVEIVTAAGRMVALASVWAGTARRKGRCDRLGQPGARRHLPGEPLGDIGLLRPARQRLAGGRSARLARLPRKHQADGAGVAFQRSARARNVAQGQRIARTEAARELVEMAQLMQQDTPLEIRGGPAVQHDLPRLDVQIPLRPIDSWRDAQRWRIVQRRRQPLDHFRKGRIRIAAGPRPGHTGPVRQRGSRCEQQKENDRPHDWGGSTGLPRSAPAPWPHKPQAPPLRPAGRPVSAAPPGGQAPHRSAACPTQAGCPVTGRRPADSPGSGGDRTVGAFGRALQSRASKTLSLHGPVEGRVGRVLDPAKGSACRFFPMAGHD